LVIDNYRAMITTKGQIIDINGKTEWLLFHRLSKKVNPVDFLSLTDSLIQFPNFLFTLSFLILIFTDLDLQVKFITPASLYFCGQIIINLRLGTGIFKLLNIPLMVFQKFSLFIMSGVFITGFFFLGWWELMVIPVYLLIVTVSVLLLTSNEKKYYQAHFNKSIGHYGIFKNNAFLLVYKYYATEYNLPDSTTPTEEEKANEDWLKPYSFMRTHWPRIEEHFNRKAKVYWRMYLHPDK
jgi:hypothetical protein